MKKKYRKIAKKYLLDNLKEYKANADMSKNIFKYIEGGTDVIKNSIRAYEEHKTKIDRILEELSNTHSINQKALAWIIKDMVKFLEKEVVLYECIIGSDSDPSKNDGGWNISCLEKVIDVTSFIYKYAASNLDKTIYNRIYVIFSAIGNKKIIKKYKDLHIKL